MSQDQRVQLEISAHLAGELERLVALLQAEYPEDEVTLHYALGYAVHSGLIAVRDAAKYAPRTATEIPVLPPLSPSRGSFRTLANPRGRVEVAAA